MKVNREWLKAHSQTKLIRQDEDVDYRNDDLEQDSKDWIAKELRNGNPWAWFSAKVTVRFQDLSADQYLGCCSYDSEASFKACGYYEQLIDECVEEIAEMLENLALTHGLWEHDKLTCVWCVAS